MGMVIVLLIKGNQDTIFHVKDLQCPTQIRKEFQTAYFVLGIEDIVLVTKSTGLLLHLPCCIALHYITIHLETGVSILPLIISSTLYNHVIMQTWTLLLASLISFCSVLALSVSCCLEFSS